MRANWVHVWLVSTMLVCGVAPPTTSQATEFPSFASKPISFIVGTPPGGGNDLYARVLAKYLPRHVAGNPAVVVQNMPGAGGITAASYVYNVAAKDGTVIATCPAGMLLGEALNPAQTHFESSKFGWIGTIATTTDVLAVWKSTGVATLQDAKQRELRIGAADQYSLSTLEPAVANAILGTKFRVVLGYGGGDAMNLAMEQHEIDGRTNQWASWKVLRPAWVSDNLLSYLLQFGPKDRGLPRDVPTLDEMVNTPEEKAIVDLLEIPQYMGRSVFAPPNIPSDRLKALQQAFDATMHDPAFVDEMRQLKLELHPQSPDAFQAALERTTKDREKTVSKMKAMLELQ